MDCDLGEVMFMTLSVACCMCMQWRVCCVVAEKHSFSVMLMSWCHSITEEKNLTIHRPIAADVIRLAHDSVCHVGVPLMKIKYSENGDMCNRWLF